MEQNAALYNHDETPVRYGFNNPFAPPPTTGPRNLRQVIPAGKGRFTKGEKGDKEYLDRIRSGQRCGIKSALALLNREHSRDMTKPSVGVIVGGGPSLQDRVGDLRRLVVHGAKTLAVNKSHDWLLKRGLPCHYAALLDPKEWVADYITANVSPETIRRAGKLWVAPTYLIASQCHEKTISKFKGSTKAYIWHAAAGLGEGDILRDEFPGEPWVLLAGGSVVGLRGVGLLYGLGFREMHLFGIDGSAKMPEGKELRAIFSEFEKAGMVKLDPGASDETLRERLAVLVEKNINLPEPVNAILKTSLYAYAKPHIDPTWKAFEVKLNTGWNRAFLSNHHMARSVYEFEDSMKHWDSEIKAGKMEPFTVKVHGDPEQSAIAMVAAGMGIHADPKENEKYGKSPP